MTFGFLLLIVVLILLFCGIGQRVLDKLHLRDKQALFLILFILVFGFLPDIPVTDLVSFNIGGFLIPFALSVYLLKKADTKWEVWRTLLASGIGALLVLFLGRIFPEEPEAAQMDINYLYGILVGFVAYLFGRSRRAAFVAGIFSIILADIAQAVWNVCTGYPFMLSLGGAGAFDLTVVSGLSALLFAEGFGEILERIEKSRKEKVKSE